MGAFNHDNTNELINKPKNHKIKQLLTIIKLNKYYSQLTDIKGLILKIRYT